MHFLMGRGFNRTLLLRKEGVMQTINIVLDGYGFLLCLIIGVYLTTGNRRNKKLNKYFGWICLLNMWMTAGDVTNWVCEGTAHAAYPFLLSTGVLIYYLCVGPILYVYTLYVVEYLKTEVVVHKKYLTASKVLCVVYMVMTVLSMFNGMFFRIAPGNVYTRGWGFWVSQAIPFFIYLINAWVIIRYKDYMEKKDIVLFLSYIILPLTAELIQALNYGIALLNTAITISLFLIFVNLQSERELLLIQREQELKDSQISIMLGQIQPHFLYNTLITIRQLCDIDPKTAKLAMREFAGFLKGNMDSLSSRMPIPIIKEINHVKHYLYLEKQRFQGRLHVKYEILEWDFSIPSLTVQTLVENAVRHGILSKQEGGTVTIHTESDEESYIVRISDEGVGFDPNRAFSDGSRHIGIENVKKRLEVLCHGNMVINSIPGKGTDVVIKIPKRKAEIR